MDDGRYDSEEAAAYARTHARWTAPGCQHRREWGCHCDPPHHLRCEWMLVGERCRLGSGHGGDHAYRDRPPVGPQDAPGQPAAQGPP